MERCLGAASDADDAALKETKGGVEIDRLPVGQVGRGAHGKLIDGVAVVIINRYHGEVAANAVFQPALVVHHLGVLADGHAIDYGHLVQTNKRGVFGLQHGTVHIKAVGVRSVEDDDGNVVFGGGFHHIAHRGDIGVEPYADILQVEENQVDALQHFGRGLLVFAVERHDGQACLLVFSAVPLGSGVGGATEAMLGREDLPHVDT